MLSASEAFFFVAILVHQIDQLPGRPEGDPVFVTLLSPQTREDNLVATDLRLSTWYADYLKNPDTREFQLAAAGKLPGQVHANYADSPGCEPHGIPVIDPLPPAGIMIAPENRAAGLFQEPSVKV